LIVEVVVFVERSDSVEKTEALGSPPLSWLVLLALCGLESVMAQCIDGPKDQWFKSPKLHAFL
jgi:hypothetical protein